jgi:hypothetical protein
MAFIGKQFTNLINNKKVPHACMAQNNNDIIGKIT